ncbi:MAG: DEDD exonuclease domain-containing protein [Buchananella hordeovulneris]|nr:DEDD exonuclease domain-containing protein [Buchananella hordeovulneris]
MRDPFELSHSPGSPEVQLSLADLDTPLAEVTFVVVDLETTGTSPTKAGITEIGAVKVRGGQVIGEFGTLVNPGVAIPPQITVLTGITTAMVVGAPRIESVLPAFFEFAGFGARDTVFVAHNASFDAGFLRAAAAAHGYDWPAPLIVDTLALSRRAFTPGEVPNHRLASLARFFSTQVEPTHRALDDARATVDVLHGLLERLAPLGVTHLCDLSTAADRVTPRRHRKASLAAGLPHAPGVYIFRDAADSPLYVGVATDLARRVRSYFTAAEGRARMDEMLALASRVEAVECASGLEAQVRELRLIKELDPPYNRRSKRPTSRPWLTLTEEAHPRLKVTTVVAPERAGVSIGPFSSRSAATRAAEAMHDVLPLRRCTTVLPLHPAARAAPCPLHELGRCAAPCAHEPAADAGAAGERGERGEGRAQAVRGHDGAREHRGENEANAGDGERGAQPQRGAVEEAAAALGAEMDLIVAPLQARIEALSQALRYEEAGLVTTRLAAFVRGADKAQRIGPLLASAQIVAGARRPGGGWELVAVRYGRLAGVAISKPGADPRPVVSELLARAEYVPAPVKLGQAATDEESVLLANWLYSPGTRLFEVDPEVALAFPLQAAARYPELVSYRRA